MTEDAVAFGSRAYLWLLAMLLVSRAADMLSTWIATPNLALEANPIARRLGWKWGVVLNLVICVLLAQHPVAAIILITCSSLIAARNFQSAWAMRALGEEQYKLWYSVQLMQSGRGMFLFCTVSHACLVGGIGVLLVFTSPEQIVSLSVGLGMGVYALAVVFFTLLATWRFIRGREHSR